MDDLNNIILVADNEETIENFNQKVSLLRKSDKMTDISLDKAYECIEYNKPDVCIINIQDYILDDVIDLISRIKANENLKELPILAFFQIFHEDVLIKLFDAGIHDYFTEKYSDTVIIMKIIWAFKKYALINQNRRHSRILQDFHIMKNKFVTAGYMPKIFNIEINKLIEHGINGNLIIISPDLQVKDKITSEKLENLIQKVTRATNLLGIKGDKRYYILFSNSNVKNVEFYINKIRKELPKDITISAGIAPINGNDFDTVEKYAVSALTKALSLTDSVIVSDGYDKTNNLYEDIQNTGNFKLFKQNFEKKMVSVITPVFYQTQKSLEEKLFDTKIEHTIKDDYSNFIVKHKHLTGTFRITHPGYSKICIDTYIRHGQHIIDKNKKSMEIEDLEKGILGDWLNKFIEEFQEKCN